MTERARRIAWYVGIIILSMSLFTACSGLSVSGGLLGSVLSLFGILALVLTLSTSQAGCEAQPCLSVVPDGKVIKDGGDRDTKVGPCLSKPPPDRDRTEPRVCLSPPLPDRSPDTKVGPCLQPPLPDRRSEPNPPEKAPDAKVGPCLTPPPPDRRSEQAPEKAPDVKVGPCLSQPPPDKTGFLAPKQDPGMQAPNMSNPVRFASRDAQRSKAIEKLQSRGVLPADVASRLRKKGQDDPKKKA